MKGYKERAMIEFTYKPDWPWLVTGGLVVAGALYWSYRAARGQANQKHRWLLFALRCVTITVVVVCLLDPQRVKEIKRFQPGYTAVLLDLSRSMTWKDDEQTRIDAAKRWIGNASFADVTIIWARDDDGNVGGFLVEKGTPGFEAKVMTGKVAKRAVWQTPPQSRPVGPTGRSSSKTSSPS